MTSRIPPEFINDLLARIDIVDLIGARIPLRKAGKEYHARCPFHEERTPSFTVSPNKQFYHCFGCGAHGTALGFLMEFDHLPFREAITELAQRVGLSIPAGTLATLAESSSASLYPILIEATQLYRRQLWENPQAQKAITYLKNRGFNQKILEQFEIGFAPLGNDFVLTHLGGNINQNKLLISCGLIVEQDRRCYDRFRDRIMFPIRDRRGRVIGFGGRLLGDGKPKYLNSPETPIFHKGRELYGLYEALQTNRELTTLIVVEGYLDVLSFAQFGLTNVVATLGTATTSEHLQQLIRHATEILFCFDGDHAGRAAAWKALEVALPTATGRQTFRFLFLPEGEDPDTLIRREGAKNFINRMQDAIPLSKFLFNSLAIDLNLNNIDGQARFAERIRPWIKKIPSGSYRDLVIKHSAKITGLQQDNLIKPAIIKNKNSHSQQPLKVYSRIEYAIAFLLDRPELAQHIKQLSDDWRRADGIEITLLSQMLELLTNAPEMNTAALLEYWREHPYFEILHRLSTAPFLRDLNAEEGKLTMIGALERINTEIRKREALPYPKY